MCVIYEDDLPTADSLLDGDFSPETTEDWGIESDVVKGVKGSYWLFEPKELEPIASIDG